MKNYYENLFLFLNPGVNPEDIKLAIRNRQIDKESVMELNEDSHCYT